MKLKIGDKVKLTRNFRSREGVIIKQAKEHKTKNKEGWQARHRVEFLNSDKFWYSDNELVKIR